MSSLLAASSVANSDNISDRSDGQIKGKVCLCCNSYTIFVVSIREPKYGPNMMEAIMEKLNRQPFDDDKYLCYSCNNWLIDWFTRQKQLDDEDVPDTVTSITAEVVADTSGTCYNYYQHKYLLYSTRTEYEQLYTVSLSANLASAT